MFQGRQVRVGLVGIGAEVVCVAAVALDAPASIWVLALIIGLALILYAVFAGEPGQPHEKVEASTLTLEQAAAVPEIRAEGGTGDGDLRGNVFGDNATINYGSSMPGNDSAQERSLIRLSPKELAETFRQHTKIQADQLIKPYIGGWISIRGEVGNVSLDEISGKHQVALGAAGETVFAEFVDDAEEQLPRLRKGEEIALIGRVVKVSALWIDLGECELLDD